MKDIHLPDGSNDNALFEQLLNYVIDWTYGYNLQDEFVEDVNEFINNELDINSEIIEVEDI